MKVYVSYTVQLPDEARREIARVRDIGRPDAKPGRLASREEVKDYLADHGLRGLERLSPPDEQGLDPDVIDAITDLI